MKSARHQSFDLVAVITTFTKGELVTYEPIINNTYTIYENFGYVWMHLKGTEILVNTKTGETIEQAPGSNLIDNPIPYGEWRALVPEDIQVVCYSPYNNRNAGPLKTRLTPVIMRVGSDRQFAHMTQLFLASGEIEVGGKTIQGPQEILFKSGDALVTARTDAYGFIVK